MDGCILLFHDIYHESIENNLNHYFAAYGHRLTFVTNDKRFPTVQRS